jgi:iron(III) transport system ATP-binding protein
VPNRIPSGPVPTERRGSAGEAPPALRLAGVTRRFGDVVAVDRVDLEVPPGSLTALLGPSGCGKTTVLRLVAGLLVPDAGAIEVGGTTVAGEAIDVPPERRQVGMVFQDHALFPHLDVRANVAFGIAHVARDQRERRVDAVLDLVGLAGFGRRRTDELSGGQAQRVALARALAPAPRLLLLDEPFSRLDATLRAAVRDEVRAILREAEQTALLVTHDQDEALSIADRVAVMAEGRVHQVADPRTLYREPATRFVAEFVGDGDVLPGRRAGRFLVDTPLGRLATSTGLDAEDVVVIVRHEQLRLRAGSDLPPASPASATVEAVAYHGHDQVVRLRLVDGRTVRSRRGPDLTVRGGDPVAIEVDGPVLAFPA